MRAGRAAHGNNGGDRGPRHEHQLAPLVQSALLFSPARLVALQTLGYCDETQTRHWRALAMHVLLRCTCISQKVEAVRRSYGNGGLFASVAGSELLYRQAWLPACAQTALSACRKCVTDRVLKNVIGKVGGPEGMQGFDALDIDDQVHLLTAHASSWRRRGQTDVIPLQLLPSALAH